VLPGSYQSLTGEPAHTLMCLLLMALGVITIALLGLSNNNAANL